MTSAQELPSEDVQAALDRAYRYLGHRDRTVSEMENYLIEREYPPVVAAEATAELMRLGYLNDEKFAELFVEDRINLDGWGRDRIRQRLTELGVSREIVDRATVLDAASEMDRALELLNLRFSGGIEGDRERQRALGFLVRRGYASELAYEAVRRVAAV